MNKPMLPKELRQGVKAERFLKIEVRDGAIDQEARTVTLAFASETPVTRCWGVEILDVASGSMDLSRMQSGAPLLVNHDPDDQVGVIESVQIGADRVARAVVRFGRSARAAEIFQDVVDGIRQGVSVGYQISSAILESEEDGVGVYRVTQWQPFEITLASLPADTSVGVGRAAPTTSQVEVITMDPQATPVSAPAPAPTPAPVDVAAVRAAAGTDAVKAERQRVADINAGADALKNHDGIRSLADKAINEGWAMDQFRAEALKVMSSKPNPRQAVIGMSDKDVRQYSFLRALHALANPSDAGAREAAAFEFEASRAAADQQSRQVKGLLVPFDVLKRSIAEGLQTRASDDLVGTASKGGNLVATQLLSANFIDLLRNAMVISRMGAQYLTGLVGNIAIPKQTGGGSFYWVAEDGSATSAGQTFGQVAMTPHTGAAKTQISRKLLQQSSIDVEAFVRGDLAKIVGLGIQQAAINGSGSSNQPTGILNVSGIGSVAGGTNGANPTWTNIVGLETDVAVANADVGTLGYLTNASVRGYLKSVQKFTTNPGGDAIWTAGDTPLNGYQTGVTNAVPANLTKGTSSGDCSAIIFGNFADLIIGMWGGLELQVDPFSAGDTGAVIVRAFQDVDIAVRHAESFSAMLDALTA